MNKLKISKILGVGLALVMVFSLMVGFMPAQKAQAAGYTPNQFNTMPIPSAAGNVLANGGRITDFAVAKDGKTIYLVDTTLNQVAKSVNAGRTFTVLTTYTGAGVGADLVAVAPDNPDVVAVVNLVGAGADIVYLSINGGSTWATLGLPAATGTNEIISSIAISPARADALLGRDFVVGTYDPATNAGGKIYINNAAVWTAVNVAALAGVGPGTPVFDFTSLALAPNWVGERAVIAIGSDNVALGTVGAADAASPGDTRLIAVNVNPITGPFLCGPATVRLDTSLTDSPSEWNTIGTGANIRSSSVVLPADFDSTSVGNFRAFVGYTSSLTGAGLILCADDAYRVDYNAVRKLEIRPALPIQSLSYSGTVGSGTLFAGESASNGVWFSSDPQSSLPSWSFSYKPPTTSAAAGAGINTVVRVAPDFASSKVVYGGVTGANCAFSQSSDGGLSFNGISWIDLAAITVINDVMPTPDGSYVFMSTEDATPMHSLWRCAGTPAVGGWDRVHFQTNSATTGFTTTGDIIRISPDNDSIYWFDYNGGLRIQRSTSNGQIWGTRTAAAAVRDAAIESKDVLYMIGFGPSVWRSDTGAWSFGLPKIPGIAGNLNNIALAPSYPLKPVAGNVLVGGPAGSGAVALSTDANTTWTLLLNFTATGAMQVVADKGYATNNTVYAGSAAVGEGIYRYTVGTSSAWEQFPTGVVATAVMTGLATFNSGLLYGAWDTATPYSGVSRSIAPTAPLASAPPWGTMDRPVALMGTSVGPVAGADINRAPSSLRGYGTTADTTLYAINIAGNDTLLAYNDTMSITTPVLTIPATVPSNPVTGQSEQFTISWPQLSNATIFLVRIYSDEAHTNQVWTNTLTAPEPAAPKQLVPRGTLIGGVYWARVLALDQVPGDAIWSPWSAMVKFTVEVGVPISVTYPSPELLAPTPGATGVALRPGFSWGAFYGATSYEFELATNPGITAGGYFVDAIVGLTGTNALTTTAWQCDKDLEYATNYYYHVKAITAGGATPWSTGTFTTMTAGVFTCPLDGLTFATQAELQAHNAVAHAPVIPQTPAYIWAVVIIGAILVIVVIALIFTTRRVS